VSETYKEWRVTATQDDGEPYQFTWSSPGHPDPEGDARRFIALVRDHAGGWLKDVRLRKRTVTVTDWEDA
jgi:hypothetical protein